MSFKSPSHLLECGHFSSQTTNFIYDHIVGVLDDNFPFFSSSRGFSVLGTVYILDQLIVLWRGGEAVQHTLAASLASTH